MEQTLKEKLKYWQFVLYVPIYMPFFFLEEKAILVMVLPVLFDGALIDVQNPFIERFH